MTSFLNDGHFNRTDQRGSVLALIKVTTGGLEESCIPCLILITLKSASQDRLDQSKPKLFTVVFGLAVLGCCVVCVLNPSILVGNDDPYVSRGIHT